MASGARGKLKRKAEEGRQKWAQLPRRALLCLNLLAERLPRWGPWHITAKTHFTFGVSHLGGQLLSLSLITFVRALISYVGMQGLMF